MSDQYPQRPNAPWLLDLFCCQGGASVGYYRAGFNVVGVDILPQPRYPFTFVCADALKVLEEVLQTRVFSAVHASPPCQAYSDCQRIRDREHPALIAGTRTLLASAELPYIIENVPGAKNELRNPLMLCGSMFPQLRVYRHRYFECGGFKAWAPAHNTHVAKQVKMGRAPKPGEWVQAVGNFSGVSEARDAMEVYWMNREGIRESIPPAYTEYLGKQLIHHIEKESTL